MPQSKAMSKYMEIAGGKKGMHYFIKLLKNKKYGIYGPRHGDQNYMGMLSALVKKLVDSGFKTLKDEEVNKRKGRLERFRYWQKLVAAVEGSESDVEDIRDSPRSGSGMRISQAIMGVLKSMPDSEYPDTMQDIARDTPRLEQVIKTRVGEQRPQRGPRVSRGEEEEEKQDYDPKDVGLSTPPPPSPTAVSKLPAKPPMSGAPPKPQMDATGQQQFPTATAEAAPLRPGRREDVPFPSRPAPPPPGGREDVPFPSRPAPGEGYGRREDVPFPSRPPPPIPGAPPAPPAPPAAPAQAKPAPKAKGLEVSDAGAPKSSKADQIPEQYLNDKFKSEAELRKDFKYFFSNFSTILQPEMRFLRNIRRGDIESLRQLHRRIVGKLRAGGQAKKGAEKFGVVVDGEEYVKNVIANMLTDQRFAQLKPKGAMVDVQRPDGQDKDVLDAGTFEIKRAQGGELAYQREPIYSAIPDTQPKQVEEERRDPRRNRPVYRLGAARTKRRDLVHTARRQVKANPFQRFTPTVQLKYLY
tara:strand:+ start:2844 stop:4418 length:1575 start_codon:yes stop_codon:yes gene_type:complete